MSSRLPEEGSRSTDDFPPADPGSGMPVLVSRTVIVESAMLETAAAMGERGASIVLISLDAFNGPCHRPMQAPESSKRTSRGGGGSHVRRRSRSPITVRVLIDSHWMQFHPLVRVSSHWAHPCLAQAVWKICSRPAGSSDERKDGSMLYDIQSSRARLRNACLRCEADGVRGEVPCGPAFHEPLSSLS